MNKPLLLLFSIFLALQIIAQNHSITNDDCSPIPWVNALILENGDIEVSWDLPFDTSNLVKYRACWLDDFNPCSGIPCEDGVLTPFRTFSPNTLFYIDLWGNPLAYALRAEYDSCYSDWTCSNVLYYDSTWYNQTFQLIVNVSLEDGGNPEGANVKVDGSNCYYETLSYENQADEEGETIFAEAMHGTYDIIISKPGYHTAMVEDFYLWQNDTVNVELKIFYVDIEEKKESNELNIFPNPATNQLNIQSEETIEEVTLINQLGQRVLVVETKEKRLALNTSDLQSGIFLLNIRTSTGIINKQVVINK